jgi:hypothetical protein
MSTEAERPPDIGFARARPVLDDVDEPFRQSLADLSRQLAARGPREAPPFDPRADIGVAPESTKPARQNRRRRPSLAVLALVLGLALAAVIHAMLGAPTEAPQSARTAVVSPPPLPEPVPPPSAAEIAPPATVAPPPPSPAAPVVVAGPEPVAPKGKLEAYEIMEIQTRLKAIGLDPGPLDGRSGPQTVAAIKQYEASKGRPQTGKLDREVLKRLRQEPDGAAAKGRAAAQ